PPCEPRGRSEMVRADQGKAASPVLSLEEAITRAFRRPPRDRFIRETIQALRADGRMDLEKVARRMEECGRHVTATWPDGRPEQARPFPNRCWVRVCPSCAAARGAKLAHRVVSLVEQIQSRGRIPKLLTLTQAARPGESWRDGYGRLRRAI